MKKKLPLLIAVLLLTATGYSAEPGANTAIETNVALVTNVPLNPSATPIPPDQASQKAQATLEMDRKYDAWKATLSPERRKWEEVLDATLGSFYLPGRKIDVLKGKPDAWDYVEDDPKLPRVLLIGDSISRGYTMDVRAALAGKANIHRAPENCGPSTRGLKNLPIHLGEGKWDVIHFNYGIHDRGTPSDVYASNLEQIIAGLEKTGAKLVWARTTPPAPGSTNHEGYTPEMCDRVNSIADGIMKSHGIPEDDLCSLVQPRLTELQLTNNVHFSDAGYQLMANQVAVSILSALGSKESPNPLSPPPSLNKAAIPASPIASMPSSTTNSATNASALPRDVELNPRLKPDGKGWGLEKAVITDPNLPRVLLIGDSILGGYKPLVVKALTGKANVDVWKNPNFQSEELNRKLSLVLDQGPYDVIHFNVGLHGWEPGRIKEGTYIPLTKAYVEVMRTKFPQAKLIWANTTPVTVKGDPSHLDPAINDIIIAHNKMAAEVMVAEHVPTNDFYGLLVGQLPLARGDGFHWTAPAYTMLANAATASILKELPERNKSSPSPVPAQQ